MERVSKRLKIFITSELKTLLRHCFKNPLYAQLPFEVWLDIVWKADLKSMLTLVSTTKAFKELVDKHLKHNVRFALLCRREDQIPLAGKCLQLCAEDGDQTAIVHLGVMYGWGGWGLSIGNMTKDWLMVAGETTNVFMAAIILAFGNYEFEERYRRAPEYVVICQIANILIWKDNAVDTDIAIAYLEPLANGGNEFAQVVLGMLYSNRRQKCLYWYTRAADQGNFMAIEQLSFMYSARDEKERPFFEKYSYKARLQQNW